MNFDIKALIMEKNGILMEPVINSTNTSTHIIMKKQVVVSFLLIFD